MYHERWRELQDLLDAAWSLAPEERAAYLDEHCADSQLRAKAEALLAADEEAEGFFDRLASDAGVTHGDEESEAADLSGRRVGRYRLLEPLGRGGMGVVYLAERADGTFEQQVAVKLLAMGLAGPEGHSRFVAERQILAGLEHPAIARLLDGGVTEDGTPYFVMERVEGERIDCWCDARGLGIRERVELICRVCEAVEYAHRRLIVHRDLKPANVLVTDDGDPKLLDFGVAKLLSDADSDVTRSRGAAPLTPAWAAPEQLEGRAITTATDTHALGALAYLLLAGVPPLDIEDRTRGAILRQLQTEPATPSRRLASLPEAKQSKIAQARSTSAGELRRRLTGDLDAILLRALAPEPERRYGSAGELAADLRRHLEGHPVHARPSSLGYRMGSFVSRHRVGVAAATIAAAALLAGLGTTLWQANVAATERDQARAESQRAEQVTEFLRDLFRASDPDQAQGREVTARELLDQGARQVRFAFEGAPELKVEMEVLLGSLYRELGALDAARPLLEEGLAAAEDIGDLKARVEALHALGVLDFDTGHHEKALAALERAEHLLYREGLVPGSSHGALIYPLLRILVEMGRFDEAVDRGEAALAAARAEPDLPPESLFGYLSALANVLQRAERTGRAETLLREALDLEFDTADLPTRRLNLHLQLALVLQRKGELEEALVHGRRVLALTDQIYPRLHYVRAEALRYLAIILNALGRYEEVESAARQALEIYDAIDPTGRSPRRAYVHNLLGLAHLRAARLAEAEPHFVRARDLAVERFGREDPFYALVLFNLGELQRLRGRHREAEELLLEALEIHRTLLGSDNPRVGLSLGYLAELRLDQSRPAEALQFADEALALFRRTGYEAPRYQVRILVTRARALDRLERVVEAEAGFAEALAVGEAAGADVGIAWPGLLAAYAEFLVGHGSPEAPAAVERAVEEHRKTFGDAHPATRRLEALVHATDPGSGH